MRRTTLALSVAVLAAALAPGSAAAQEQFIANAISMGTVSGTARMEFTVDRWSTEEERAEYLRILAEDGEGALVDALHEAGGVGRVRVNARLSYPISYAYQIPDGNGGRRIVLATDRPINALEAVRQARTLDYAVSIAELRMPAEGSGEGALMVAALITIDPESNSITLENFGQAPVQLRSVRSR